MRILSIVLLLFWSLNLNAQKATFDVTASGTNATIDSAIDYACMLWSDYLNSSVPIKVKINYVDMTSLGPLGITFPNGERDFSGAPIANTWYAACLANSIVGSRINTGEDDMEIYLNANSSINWYFGLDGLPAGSQYDFVSVVLHEIGHGLGVLSLAKVDTIGSYGYLTLTDFNPLTTSFPWPDLMGMPSAFDRLLENESGDKITDTTKYNNPSADLETLFTSNKVYYNGPNGVAANGGTRFKVHAPSTYALGTSITHIHNSFGSGVDGLMAPFIGKGEVHHAPGNIAIGILTDIGWTIIGSGIEELQLINSVVFPNPFANELYIKSNFEYDDDLIISIIDINGAVVASRPASVISGQRMIHWSIDDLPTGIYLLTLEGEHHRSAIKILHQ